LSFRAQVFAKQSLKVLAGASKAEQVRANAAAAEWELSAQDMREIDAIVKRAR